MVFENLGPPLSKDHSHTMYSSGNINVRNLVHLFESRCILDVSFLKDNNFSPFSPAFVLNLCSSLRQKNIFHIHIYIYILPDLRIVACSSFGILLKSWHSVKKIDLNSSVCFTRTNYSDCHMAHAKSCFLSLSFSFCFMKY